MIKQQSRNVDFFFGIHFPILTLMMLVCFMIDMEKKECQEDARFQKMSLVAQVIMFLAAIHGIFQLVNAIQVGLKLMRARKRSRMDPP